MPRNGLSRRHEHTLKIADSHGIAVVTFARPPVNAMDSGSL
jgi:hypothetical protein